MATYAQFKHVELYKIGHGKNRVPNAPKSSIGEIFSHDAVDSKPVKNGNARPRTVRDTPTRPRDTHSRLFGQVATAPVVPMVTDTIRSHIQFGDAHTNGVSSSPSPTKSLPNGSASSTPSRGEVDLGDHSSYKEPKRNPVTGDGVLVPPPPRRHPMASLREGNPITGEGYRSMNGQINTVTSSVASITSPKFCHSRVPPGGYSSKLW